MKMSINQEVLIPILSVVVTKNKEEYLSKREEEAIKDLIQEIEVRVRAVKTTTITTEAILVEEVSSINNINNNLNRYQ